MIVIQQAAELAEYENKRFFSQFQDGDDEDGDDEDGDDDLTHDEFQIELDNYALVQYRFTNHGVTVKKSLASRMLNIYRDKQRAKASRAARYHNRYNNTLYISDFFASEKYETYYSAEGWCDGVFYGL
jgi:hypothetical protein